MVREERSAGRLPLAWSSTKAWVALWVGLALGCSSASDPRPNILVILTDDHAVSMMSAYGEGRAQTPNIDRIAQQGTLFKNSFVTNSICSPSRASLLTGKYSHANGVRVNDVAFDGAQPTFPKALQRAGYETALIGKWHLQSAPTGFDYWSVLPGQGSYQDPVMFEMGTRRERAGYVTDVITEDALAWLEGRDETKPFLLMHQHKAPHGEWRPSEKNSAKYENEVVPVPATFSSDRTARTPAVRAAANRMVPDLLRKWVLLGEANGKKSAAGLTGIQSRAWLYQEYVRDYRRVLLSVDESVGAILDYLDAEGLSENTIVVYTSDNGLLLGEHGLVDKRLMYEESLRVPLVVSFPGSVAEAAVVEEVALNVDVAPTLLDFAGVPPLAGAHGRSLRPLLEGRSVPDWRDSFYYEYFEEGGYFNVTRHYGLRTERYKLIHYTGSYRVSASSSEMAGPVDEWELIDMHNDPAELRNVYAEVGYSGVVAELKNKLAEHRRSLGVPEAGSGN